MKIYDCFTYFDEMMLLNFRLNCLDKYVDKFVIVECKYSHKGIKKGFNFDLKKITKFKDKIIYIQVNKKPFNLNIIKKTDDKNTINSKHILNGYIWDHFQRNKIIEGIKDCNSDDIIMISDLDEIPNLKNINFSKIKEKLIFFRQKILFYKFNLLYRNRFWFGSRACKKKYLLSPQWIRDVKHKKYNFFRFDLLFSKKKYSDIFYVNNGGWHYTNLKSPKDIFKKLTNYAHYLEFQLSKIKFEDIKKMILKKRAIYNHEVDQRGNKFNGDIKLYKFNKRYWPEYLKLNYHKYKKWIA
jgi:beta-1,4-mannosyl-glycoprotein beta-1,4-N-acetylglucosaminyltransferase